MGHINVGGLADHAVKAFGCQRVKDILLPAVQLYPFHHLKSLLPKPIHVDDLLWRVLQITVNDHTASFFLWPAALVCGGKPSKNGGLFTKIAGKANAVYVVVCFCSLDNLKPCLIL